MLPLMVPVVLFLLLLAGSCGLTLTLAEADDPQLQVAAQGVLLCFDAIVIVAAVWISRGVLRKVLGMPRHLHHFAWGIGLGLSTFAVACVSLVVQRELLHVDVTDYAPSFLQAGYGWGFVALVLVAQPAIFEELAFRGVTDRRSRRC